ncbi:hypothetical protein TNCV_4355831 [Trichonephila clavipes]|nr:hypothetical protein TNCV_4355831 [Trichonephila clavipes]
MCLDMTGDLPSLEVGQNNTFLPQNFVSCQQGKCKNCSCNFGDRRPPITRGGAQNNTFLLQNSVSCKQGKCKNCSCNFGDRRPPITRGGAKQHIPSTKFRFLSTGQICNFGDRRPPITRGGAEQHIPSTKFVSCQQGKCKNCSCNFGDRRPPITRGGAKQHIPSTKFRFLSTGQMAIVKTAVVTWGKTTHSFHKIPFPVNRANVKTATGDLPTLEVGQNNTFLPQNSVSCQQGKCKNCSCNFGDRRPPITRAVTGQFGDRRPPNTRGGAEQHIPSTKFRFLSTGQMANVKTAAVTLGTGDLPSLEVGQNNTFLPQNSVSAVNRANVKTAVVSLGTGDLPTLEVGQNNTFLPQNSVSCQQGKCKNCSCNFGDRRPPITRGGAKQHIPSTKFRFQQSTGQL